MTGMARGVDIDVAAFQQIVEAADAVPAITVGFQQHLVPALFAGFAVVFRQQVDQVVTGVAGNTGRE